MLLLTQLSVEKRFLEYATSQILDRLNPLEKAIVDVYSENESLTPFLEDAQRWNRLRDATYRQYLRHQKNRRPFFVKPESLNQTDKPESKKQIEANQRIFFHHLTLHDSKEELISGQQLDSFKYVKQAVYVEEKIIAYIGYIKPKAFLNPVDQVFVDQQFRAFAIICVAMIFTSLIIAAFVSKWLVSPLTILSKNANKVASGDFSVRTPITRNDELGELCARFNEMAKTLEENEKARKQWVADISHELRTPISVLKAQIEAMEDGIRPTTPKNLGLLKKNIDSLGLIVNDLYELSLSDMGALSYDKHDTNVIELVEDEVNAYSSRFENQELSLSFQCKLDAKHSTLFLDKKRCKQLIDNVLENSLRYTDSPGSVHITLFNTGESIIIKIEDSPPSIPENAIDKIFDRLYRVDTSRSRNHGGAGLGLSICKNIVEAHGGSISASPSTLGGIAIEVRFPTGGTP